MKNLFLCFSAMIVMMSGCVTHVEGQRTNGKALAVMATEDIERIVDSSEELDLYNKADKEILVWKDQEFQVSLDRRMLDDMWKIEEISRPEVIMPVREINYEKEWVFIFKTLEQGKARVVFTRRRAADGKIIQKEIIDVNVE